MDTPQAIQEHVPGVTADHRTPADIVVILSGESRR